MLESLCQIKTPKQHKGNEMEQAKQVTINDESFTGSKEEAYMGEF